MRMTNQSRISRTTMMSPRIPAITGRNRLSLPLVLDHVPLMGDRLILVGDHLFLNSRTPLVPRGLLPRQVA